MHMIGFCITRQAYRNRGRKFCWLIALGSGFCSRFTNPSVAHHGVENFRSVGFVLLPGCAAKLIVYRCIQYRQPQNYHLHLMFSSAVKAVFSKSLTFVVLSGLLMYASHPLPVLCSRQFAIVLGKAMSRKQAMPLCVSKCGF